jgi:hypothetical protein
MMPWQCDNGVHSGSMLLKAGVGHSAAPCAGWTRPDVAEHVRSHCLAHHLHTCIRTDPGCRIPYDTFHDHNEDQGEVVKNALLFFLRRRY